MLTIAVRPIIVEPMPHALVDSRNSHHVGFSPLPTEISRLQLQQFQGVELHHCLLDTQRFTEDRGGFHRYENLEGHIGRRG